MKFGTFGPSKLVASVTCTPTTPTTQSVIRPTGALGYSIDIMVSKYYCKTLYFSCILIWRFCTVEIWLHFNLAFCQGVLCKIKFHVTSHMN